VKAIDPKKYPKAWVTLALALLVLFLLGMMLACAEGAEVCTWSKACYGGKNDEVLFMNGTGRGCGGCPIGYSSGECVVSCIGVPEEPKYVEP